MAKEQLLPITVSASTYEKLERLARKEDRHPIRQAQYMIKRAIEAATSEVGSCE